MNIQLFVPTSLGVSQFYFHLTNVSLGSMFLDFIQEAARHIFGCLLLLSQMVCGTGSFCVGIFCTHIDIFLDLIFVLGCSHNNDKDNYE